MLLDTNYYVADAAYNQVKVAGSSPGESSDGKTWNDSFSTPATTTSDGSFDDNPFGGCLVGAGHVCVNGKPQAFRLTSGKQVLTINTNTTSIECTDGIKVTIQGNPAAQNKVYTQGNVQ